jgi:ABC-2 type transport system permease protein
MWERILTLLRKEFRSVLRDPRMRVVIFGLPVLQTLIFGYAVTLDVRHVPLAIVDRDNTPASRELVARFTGSAYFDAVARPTSDDEARALIDSTTAAAVLQIDAGYERRLHAGQPVPVQLIVDGADSNTARYVVNYANVIAATSGQHPRARPDAPAAARPLRVRRERRSPAARLVQRRSREPPFLRARSDLAAGHVDHLMLTSMAIVREKGRHDRAVMSRRSAPWSSSSASPRPSP